MLPLMIGKNARGGSLARPIVRGGAVPKSFRRAILLGLRFVRFVSFGWLAGWSARAGYEVGSTVGR